MIQLKIIDNATKKRIDKRFKSLERNEKLRYQAVILNIYSIQKVIDVEALHYNILGFLFGEI